MVFGCFYFTDSQINQIEPKLFVLFGTSLFLMFEPHGYLEQVINNKVIKYIGHHLFQFTLFINLFLVIIEFIWKGLLIQLMFLKKFLLVSQV